ncbi:DEAD/DEAH box helicase [Hyphomicrobiales bacterium]|nr:DEAD/DEAH box helicase [Hyphomicrobiales bacterium]
MTEFKDLGLNKRVIQAIEKENYVNPTPIQEKVIPVMLEGRDIVGTAQTGTGKTAAFVLPLLHRIEEEGRRAKPRTCTNLIIVPTRELATQIFQNVAIYGKFIPHSKTVVMGGARAGAQIKALSRGLDIVIATPGRLEDHLSTNSISLNDTRTVILDEADQMMDLGFFPAIRRIMSFLPTGHQTLLLSATMPKQVRSLAKEFLTDPIDVSIGQQSKPIEKINQKILLVSQPSKKRLLVEILSDVYKAIVFTRTKHGADKVVRYLKEKGIESTAIHGNKSQGQRQRSLDMFKKDKVNILVATDIAARGIDIDEVSHVVNFDMPNVPESYVHRIGRTARAGSDGIAISLCDSSEVPYLRDIEKLIDQKIPRERVMEDGTRKEVFYDPAEELNDHSKSKKKKSSNSRGKKKSYRGRDSDNFSNKSTSSSEKSFGKSKKPHRGKGSGNSSKKEFSPFDKPSEKSQSQFDKEINKSPKPKATSKPKGKGKKPSKFFAKLEKVKKANTSDSEGYISKDSKRDDKKSKFKNSKKSVNSSSGANKKSSKSKSNKKPLSTKIFKSN